MQAALGYMEEEEIPRKWHSTRVSVNIECFTVDDTSLPAAILIKGLEYPPRNLTSFAKTNTWQLWLAAGGIGGGWIGWSPESAQRPLKLSGLGWSSMLPAQVGVAPDQ
jgi:hypothetical protein